MGNTHDRRFYGRGCGSLFEGFESRKLEGGQGQDNAYLFHLYSPSWKQTAPQNDAAVVAQAAPPSRDKPHNLQYTGLPRIWPTPIHPGCADL